MMEKVRTKYTEKAIAFDRTQDRQNNDAKFEDAMLERALEDWRASTTTENIDELSALINLNSHKNNEIFQRTGHLDMALLTANDKLVQEIKDIRAQEFKANPIKIDIGGLM